MCQGKVEHGEESEWKYATGWLWDELRLLEIAQVFTALTVWIEREDLSKDHTLPCRVHYQSTQVPMVWRGTLHGPHPIQVPWMCRRILVRSMDGLCSWVNEYTFDCL